MCNFRGIFLIAWEFMTLVWCSVSYPIPWVSLWCRQIIPDLKLPKIFQEMDPVDHFQAQHILRTVSTTHPIELNDIVYSFLNRTRFPRISMDILNDVILVMIIRNYWQAKKQGWNSQYYNMMVSALWLSKLPAWTKISLWKFLLLNIPSIQNI